MAALQKTFECLACKAPIKLERDRVNNKWIRYELNGTALHKCQQQKQRQQQQQEQQQQQQPSSDVSKEIGAIKAQLLVLVGRLDRLEQELGK